MPKPAPSRQSYGDIMPYLDTALARGYLKITFGCKLTALEYEHGERSWSDDVRAVRAIQDNQDAEELF